MFVKEEYCAVSTLKSQRDIVKYYYAHWLFSVSIMLEERSTLSMESAVKTVEQEIKEKGKRYVL